MPTTMICLIGEQAIPNIMGVFLCQRWIERPHRVICLVSEDLEYRRESGKRRRAREFEVVYSGIYECLNDLDDPIWDVSLEEAVSPYDTDEITSRVADLIRRIASESGPDENIVVNITGGTKVMSLGSYLAAQAGDSDLRLASLYVDTEDTEVVWRWMDEREEQRRKFDYAELAEIDVARYLLSYGVELTQPGETQPPTALVEAAGIVANHQAAGIELAQAVALTRQKHRATPVTVTLAGRVTRGEPRDVLEQLSQKRELGLKVEEIGDGLKVTLTSDMQRFFWGRRWLEYHVFDQVRRARREQDSSSVNPEPELPPVYQDVRLNAMVNWRGIEQTGLFDEPGDEEEDPGSVANELDVVASRGARLLVCECKTNRGAPKPQHLYKLQVVGTRAGTFVDRVLVTTRSGVSDPYNEKTRTNVVRALTMDILVTGARELPKLANILREPEDHLKELKREFGLLPSLS